MGYDGISIIKNLKYIIFCATFLLLLTKRDIRDTRFISEKQGLQKVLYDRELRIAILNNYTSYFIYKGTPMGFNYEIARAYAKYLGVNLKIIVVSDYNEAFRMQTARKCSMFAESLSITQKRTRKMLFTTPILRSKPVLVQNKNSLKQYFEDWLAVDSIKVSVCSGSISESLIAHIQDFLGIYFDVDVLDGKGQEEIIKLVALDSVSATIADQFIAKTAKVYYPHLDIKTSVGVVHNLAWTLNNQFVDLKENFDNWFHEYKKSKYYRTLYIKYFLNRNSILRNKKGFISSTKQLSPYDDVIKTQAKIMGWDWRLLAALMHEESRFDPKRVSWAGAFGVMQLMPRTAKSLGVSKSSSPEEHIEAGRKFLQILKRQLAKIVINDSAVVNKFVIAAYNAGLEHIKDSIRLTKVLGGDPNSWEDVSLTMINMSNPEYYKHKVVKYGYFRGKATVNYVIGVHNIYRDYQSLL